MPFSIKVTLVEFRGDTERYPCHATMNVGDELIFDGLEFKGKICAHTIPVLAPHINTLYKTGPRFINPGYYNLFWSATLSEKDLSMKQYDGNGNRNVFEKHEEPKYHMTCLSDPDAWYWPPRDNREDRKHVLRAMCPDLRTAAVFNIEAYDLATAGDALPFTRRQMTIMDRVHKAGGTWPVDKILDLYTEFEILKIYPPLSEIIIPPMLDDLESLSYAIVKDGNVTITKEGADRVARYKTEIPAEDVEALKL